MDLSHEIACVIIIIALPAYIFSVVCNLLLIGTIVSNRTLHEPMYILLCNLSFNDIVGISALVPRTIFDIMFDYGFITFPACFLQAWCLHTYGGATVLILSVMAFDRYVAICHPLRYHTIMSKATLIHLISSSWIIVFVLVVILFGLTLQHPVCGNKLSSYYCDNMTILKLTCATDTTVSNIYGPFLAGFLQAVSLFSIVFTYTLILITCCKSNNSESKSKAWHTCGTHLTVFVIHEISSVALVLFHRFPNMPNIVPKVLELEYVILPNCINPVIYGLKTKDIRVKVKNFRDTIIGLNNLKRSKHKFVKAISSL
ncbi:olfactory receptor 4K3-like [Colossoma macropomum]|uniref:olfactory receptor 4K3-like n=1 Tax=Colossoma macropomum TaxID=42526 RepID=UPI001864F63C|nr:olfactory receptor 4K3-like [Colossoma macropomum]